MQKPVINTVEDGIAWLAANGCGLNALMQHENHSWRASIRVKNGERGMTGQHIWRDAPTAAEAMASACRDMWAMSNAPPTPVTPARKRLPVVEEPAVTPPVPPRRRLPLVSDDVV